MVASVPLAVTNAGDHATHRFIQFFVTTIRNRNTREAYARAVRDFFEWLEVRRVTHLDLIEPIAVSAYIEALGETRSRPTVKQHLAAVKKLFDWLVVGQVLPHNPASSVRGPAYSVRRGKTPCLTAAEARRLLDSIDTSTVVGLRDRALIGLMVYTFARVSAATGMLVEHYFQSGREWKILLHEKGGKVVDIPAHHNLAEYLDTYLAAAGLVGANRTPLFRSANGRGRLTERSLSRNHALKMVKRRAIKAGVPSSTCCHTFRATGLTVFLKNDGKIEDAQAMAGHSSLKTTKLYDRRDDKIGQDQVERILI